MEATREKRENIEERARVTLFENGLFRYPVDVLAVAGALNLDVYKADFQNPEISGMIRCENGKTAIYYNSADHVNRARFTVAHEIGHFVLGHLDELGGRIADDQLNMFRRSDERANRKNGDRYRMEVEANWFAAALLMPEKLVRNVWNDNRGDVEKTARLFMVSQAALGYRVDYLDSRE